MSHTKFTVLVLFAVIAALSVTPANAIPVYGTVDITSHINSSTTANLSGTALDGSSGGGFYTGVYSWTVGATTGLGAAVPNWGFCIELAQDATTGTEDVISLSDAPQPPEYGTPMGDIKANYIRELWGRDFDPTWASGGNPIAAEAFSFAVWEIIYETDPTWDVTSGAGFSTTDTSGAAGIANGWLSQLNGNSAYFANNLYAISSPDGQDYVVQIPEPATLSLLAVGAAALLRRRKS
jgi:PEP-CTERM motif